MAVQANYTVGQLSDKQHRAFALEAIDDLFGDVFGFSG